MSHFYSLTVHSPPNSPHTPNELMYANSDLTSVIEARRAYTAIVSSVSTRKYGWLVNLSLVNSLGIHSMFSNSEPLPN